MAILEAAFLCLTPQLTYPDDGFFLSNSKAHNCQVLAEEFLKYLKAVSYSAETQ